MKTHWKQSPNKNYLGHWDLPDGKDIVLTIDSAAWEEVKNPLLNTKEVKRVIRFKEKYRWIKPFICNETNAKSILKAIQTPYMEDSSGKMIKIGPSKIKVKREEVDCLRVRDISSQELEKLVEKISEDEIKQIKDLISQSDKITEEMICKPLKINSIAEISKAKFNAIVKRIKEIISEDVKQ